MYPFINELAANKDGIEIVIKIGTFAISALTLMVTIIGAFKTFISFILDRRDKQLADFIASFSDEKEIKRLSGINGLSRYSGQLFKELFFICSIEKDAIIRELIYESLQSRSAHMKAQCIQMNDFLVNYFLLHDYHSGALQYLKKEQSIMKPLSHSQTNRRIQLELNRRNPSSLFEQDCAIDNHLLLSSKLLASAMSKSFHIKLSGSLILQSNMYSSRWILNSLRNCVFINNVARHMFSLLTSYDYCCIKDNNYFDSRLIKTHFFECTLDHSSFRNSHITQTVFLKGAIQNVVFSQSVLKKCSYIQIKDISMSSWNGCTIKHSRFEQVQMKSNEMSGTKFVAAHFIDIRLWQNKLMGQFINCRFKNVVWGGSILRNVEFINCVSL